MIWLTGDTHGHFDRVEAFCREQQTTTDDILIILGDSGFNFGGGERDRFLKTRATQFPITIFSLHGNRENRPQNIPGYVEGSFHGGKILYEPQYPNLLFAVDGEVYRFAGTDCLVVGGAYSTGKEYRLVKGLGWWPDEQPSDETKRQVEARGLKVEQSAPGGVMPDPHFSTNPAKVRFTPDLKDYPEALVKAYQKREKENPSL